MTESAPIEPAPRLHPWLRILVAVALVLGLLAMWKLSGVKELDSASRVAEAVRALRATPYALVYVLAAYVVAALVFIPISFLSAGTVLALGPLEGTTCALLGTVISAAIGWLVGHALGRAPLERYRGPRLDRIIQLLSGRAFRATVLARLMPVGNFNVINLIAGSLGVPFQWFLLGNAVGVAPWLIVCALFVEQAVRLLE
jgi:phospholipase D1/2